MYFAELAYVSSLQFSSHLSSSHSFSFSLVNCVLCLFLQLLYDDTNYSLLDSVLKPMHMHYTVTTTLACSQYAQMHTQHCNAQTTYLTIIIIHSSSYDTTCQDVSQHITVTNKYTLGTSTSITNVGYKYNNDKNVNYIGFA